MPWLTLSLSSRARHKDARSSAGQTEHPTSLDAATDWFQIVQKAQDWPSRAGPEALAQSLGKEALSFQLADYTPCYYLGRDFGEESQLRKKRCQAMKNKKFLRTLFDHLKPMVPKVVVVLDFPLYGKEFPFLFKPV